MMLKLIQIQCLDSECHTLPWFSNLQNHVCTSSANRFSLLATLEKAVKAPGSYCGIFELAAQKDLLNGFQGDKFNVKIASLSHDMSNNEIVAGPIFKQQFGINDRGNVRWIAWLIADWRTISPPPTRPISNLNSKWWTFNYANHDFTLDADGCLTAENVQLPPKPAVYTLRISHNRPGWSQLAFEEQILVNPSATLFRSLVAFPLLFQFGLVSWFASYFILLPFL